MIYFHVFPAAKAVAHPWRVLGLKPPSWALNLSKIKPVRKNFRTWNRFLEKFSFLEDKFKV